MTSKKTPAITLLLTPEQQAELLQATGRKLTQIELQPQVLEVRAAPGIRVAN